MGPGFSRKYATATASGTHVYLPLVVINTDDLASSANWTPVAGDVKLSKDGGAQANITTLPTYSNGQWIFQLSATELTCKTLAIVVVDQGTKAVEDQFVLIETFGHASALYPFDLSVATQTVNLSSTAVDAVWDEPLTEPTTVFSWGGTFRQALNFVFAWSRNKITQSATTTTLRNDADNATIATRTISDSGTVLTDGEAG